LRRAAISQTHGQLVIGSEKVQELTESSQRVGILCKTCCIANQSGKINAEQFQVCLDTTKQYQTHVVKVADSIDQASAAKARGDTQTADQKASQAIADATAVTTTVDKLSAASGTASGAAASPTMVEHCDDRAGRAPKHLFRLGTDRQHSPRAARVFLHRDHRRLVANDPFALDVYQGVGGAEIDRDIIGEPAEN
jgi:hypothetical protein